MRKEINKSMGPHSQDLRKCQQNNQASNAPYCREVRWAQCEDLEVRKGGVKGHHLER